MTIGDDAGNSERNSERDMLVVAQPHMRARDISRENQA